MLANGGWCTADPATGRWEALSGVNITLGLPVVRTSVDHGTAFDIAGQGIANALSLIEAIEYAERLAAARGAGPLSPAEARPARPATASAGSPN